MNREGKRISENAEWIKVKGRYCFWKRLLVWGENGETGR